MHVAEPSPHATEPAILSWLCVGFFCRLSVPVPVDPFVILLVFAPIVLVIVLVLKGMLRFWRSIPYEGKLAVVGTVAAVIAADYLSYSWQRHEQAEKFLQRLKEFYDSMLHIDQLRSQIESEPTKADVTRLWPKWKTGPKNYNLGHVYANPPSLLDKSEEAEQKRTLISAFVAMEPHASTIYSFLLEVDYLRENGLLDQGNMELLSNSCPRSGALASHTSFEVRIRWLVTHMFGSDDPERSEGISAYLLRIPDRKCPPVGYIANRLAQWLRTSLKTDIENSLEEERERQTEQNKELRAALLNELNTLQSLQQQCEADGERSCAKIRQYVGTLSPFMQNMIARAFSDSTSASSGPDQQPVSERNFGASVNSPLTSRTEVDLVSETVNHSVPAVAESGNAVGVANLQILELRNSAFLHGELPEATEQEMEEISEALKLKQEERISIPQEPKAFRDEL
jgi:hypothetical protein